MRVVLVVVIEDAEPDHDCRGRRDQAQQRGERPDRAAKFQPDRHRHVDDVPARQELAEAEQLGELLAAHPAALLDDHGPGQRQDPAEADQAEEEKAAEKLSDGRFRASDFGIREVGWRAHRLFQAAHRC